MLFKYLNYPLFVPEQNRGALAVLAERGLPEMMAELERLSTLGSAWAGSTLGYLSLLPTAEGARDPKRAIDLCSRAAAAADSYALFITAWAQFVLTQNRVTSAPAMIQSSRLQFSPAILAMAFFVWPNTEMALRYVDEAARRGHAAAWSFRCGFFKTGRLGVVRRIWGYILTPVARLRYVLAVWRNPFSVDVLFVNLTDRRPAIRQ